MCVCGGVTTVGDIGVIEFAIAMNKGLLGFVVGEGIVLGVG